MKKEVVNIQKHPERRLKSGRLDLSLSKVSGQAPQTGDLKQP